ncbi:hypothetical protein AB0D14_27565 [Streptomyces sp. NPDC048484]|uniref:hypothetical protein n=1 Tax=Streptomyces sp. NPDC048484 TaxID=3155146 RepID=UPI00341369CD
MSKEKEEKLPVPLRPESLKDLVIWGVDAAQAFATIVSPIVALLVALPGMEGLRYVFMIFCLIACLFGIWLFKYVFTQPNPSRYATKKDDDQYATKKVTIVTISGLGANAAGIIFAALIAVF